MTIFFAIVSAFMFGTVCGGLIQTYLGFRPQGWEASNGKRYRTVEISKCQD